MSPAGFEPTIPANKRPQTHALDRAATGIGDKPYAVNECIDKKRNVNSFGKIKVG
jgi:hypothetical protein